jgi:glutamine synthetase
MVHPLKASPEMMNMKCLLCRIRLRIQILLWRPKESVVGRMFCDILEPDGSEPYEGDPRQVLKKSWIEHLNRVMPSTFNQNYNTTI